MEVEGRDHATGLEIKYIPKFLQIFLPTNCRQCALLMGFRCTVRGTQLKVWGPSTLLDIWLCPFGVRKLVSRPTLEWELYWNRPLGIKV